MNVLLSSFEKLEKNIYRTLQRIEIEDKKGSRTVHGVLMNFQDDDNGDDTAISISLLHVYAFILISYWLASSFILLSNCSLP